MFLNHRTYEVCTFHCHRNDRTNRPPQPAEAFVRGNAPLKGAASQKWCLFRLSPQIIASRIPEGNEDWEVDLLFREVVDLLLSYEIPSESLVYIVMKNKEFLHSFVTHYPDARIIPK